MGNSEKKGLWDGPLAKLLVLLALVIALSGVAASSGTWALKGHPVVPSALVAPAADAAIAPVVCGNCDGGGYVCDVNHDQYSGNWTRNPYGQWCVRSAPPGWPWVYWSWV